MRSACIKMRRILSNLRKKAEKIFSAEFLSYKKEKTPERSFSIGVTEESSDVFGYSVFKNSRITSPMPFIM
jgi:hypothetical protein